jgi:hypothetical protein
VKSTVTNISKKSKWSDALLVDAKQKDTIMLARALWQQIRYGESRKRRNYD